MPVPKRTTGNETTTALGAGRPRRGRPRLLREKLNKLVANWHELKTHGCNQQQRLRRERKFELRQRLGKLHLLGGFFGVRDDFAKGAGMLAVKRSHDGVRKRAGAKVFGEHPRPRDGLQRAPVRTGSRQQHEDQ